MEEPENFTGLNASSSLIVYPFQEVSKLEICTYMSGFLFCLPLHSYVFWLIVRGTGGGFASEFCNVNLSICGIIFSVNSLLILCAKWFHDPSLTMLSIYFWGLAITGHPLFQCLMCVERYLAVVHPVIFLKTKPPRYRVICSVITWLVILASCGAVTVFSLFYFELLFSFILAQLVIFLSIQIFCCVSVLRALKQSGPGERRRVEENHMKRQAAIIIIVTVVALIITYVPLSITVFLMLVNGYTNNLMSICYIYFILAGFCMPVLFLQRTGKLSCLLHICRYK